MTWQLWNRLLSKTGQSFWGDICFVNTIFLFIESFHFNRSNLLEVSVRTNPDWPCFIILENCSTCQLPIGAGHCQWGGLTDRNICNIHGDEHLASNVSCQASCQLPIDPTSLTCNNIYASCIHSLHHLAFYWGFLDLFPGKNHQQYNPRCKSRHEN